MMTARRREDAIANSRPAVVDEIMAELPSSLYVPPQSSVPRAQTQRYSSMEDAVKTMGGLASRCRVPSLSAACD